MSKLSRSRSVVFLVVIALTAACGGDPVADLDFTDWIVDVPEGTPIKEYAPVSVDERAGREVELVEDLVIGGDAGDPNTAFYRAVGVVASDEGDIYVLDSGNSRVQVFAADGSFVRTFGGPGQGPGEFQQPLGMTLTGDRVMVNDMRNNRLSYWSLDGEHVRDLVPPQRIAAPFMNAFADGSIVAFATDIDRETMSRKSALIRYSAEGEKLGSLLELPAAPMPDMAAVRTDPLAILRMAVESMDQPNLVLFGIGGGGETVYASPMAEYQLFAKGSSGDWIWALRAAWPRPPFPAAQKEAMISSFAQQVPDRQLSVDDFDWPEHTLALSMVQVDGRGRIYVFPAVFNDTDTTGAEAATGAGTAGVGADAEETTIVPVDVYSPDGELLLAGLISSSWSYARGDHVYTLRPTPDDEV